MPRSIIVPLIALSLLSVAAYHVAHNSQIKPALAAPAAPARTPWGDSIAGTGIVEPWTENVAVGTHVAGVVQDVLVKVGQAVTRGAPSFALTMRQSAGRPGRARGDAGLGPIAVRRRWTAAAPEELPGSRRRRPRSCRPGLKKSKTATTAANSSSASD